MKAFHLPTEGYNQSHTHNEGVRAYVRHLHFKTHSRSRTPRYPAATANRSRAKLDGFRGEMLHVAVLVRDEVVEDGPDVRPPQLFPGVFPGGPEGLRGPQPHVGDRVLGRVHQQRQHLGPEAFGQVRDLHQALQGPDHAHAEEELVPGQVPHRGKQLLVDPRGVGGRGEFRQGFRARDAHLQQRERRGRDG